MRAGEVIAEQFELIRLAGSGGMGQVWEARDRLQDARVAVKLLTGTSQSGRTRFLREAVVLAQLRHPGIVRYVAHGVTPAEEIYLAMEWLEGEDLAHRLERGVAFDRGHRGAAQGGGRGAGRGAHARRGASRYQTEQLVLARRLAARRRRFSTSAWPACRVQRAPIPAAWSERPATWHPSKPAAKKTSMRAPMCSRWVAWCSNA